MGDDGDTASAVGRRALIGAVSTAFVTGGLTGTAHARTGPEALFYVDPFEPDPGRAASLVGTPSKTEGAEIVSYEWVIDTASGTRTATGEQAEHTWSTESVYEVTLTVTDADGRSDSTANLVDVFNEDPKPTFVTDPEFVDPGDRVTLDASSSTDPDGDIVEYRWKITGADGETTETRGEQARYTWPDAGTYAVELTVADDGGTAVTTTEEIRVGNEPPGAVFSASTTEPAQYESVTLDGSLSVDVDGEVVAHRWVIQTAYGEQYATGPEIQYAFQESGQFDVTLTVEDDDGDTDSYSERFTISPAETPGTPTDTPTGTPPGTPTETPTGTPPGTPTETPTGTPPGTPTETPTGTPPGTPTETPAETPTEPTTTGERTTTATTVRTIDPDASGESSRELSAPTPTAAPAGAGIGQSSGSDEQSDSTGLLGMVAAGAAVLTAGFLYSRRSGGDDRAADADHERRPTGTDGGTATVDGDPIDADRPGDSAEPSTREVDWNPQDPESWVPDDEPATSDANTAVADPTTVDATGSRTAAADPGEQRTETDPTGSEGTATDAGATGSDPDTATTDTAAASTEATAVGSDPVSDTSPSAPTDRGVDCGERADVEAGSLGFGPGGEVAANPDTVDDGPTLDVTETFVDTVPAVASATLVSGGPVYKFRGSMANGPDDVWFWTVDPDYVGDEAVADAFDSRVTEWATVDDSRYVAHVVDYDTDPRPWVAFLAAEQTIGSMDRSLSRRQCRAVVDGVTQALQAGDDAGVAHYTLTPDHVHVIEDGEPAAVVSDWGLSAAVAEAAGADQEPTPYDAPEQVYDDDPLEETEVYRLAAVCYHALTAAEPAESYQFDPEYDLERTIIDRQYTPVTRHDSSLRPAIDAVLKQAMEPNPDARHSSKELFRRSLRGSF